MKIYAKKLTTREKLQAEFDELASVFSRERDTEISLKIASPIRVMSPGRYGYFYSYDLNVIEYDPVEKEILIDYVVRCEGPNTDVIADGEDLSEYFLSYADWIAGKLLEGEQPKKLIFY